MTALLLGLATATLVVVMTRPVSPRAPWAPTTARRRLPSRDALRGALDRWLPHARERRRDRQLPVALDRLASSLRAGAAIGPAVATLAAETADPLGAELRRIAHAVEHGATVADALRAWSTANPRSRDVRLVAAALTVGAGAGGEVARAVDGVATTLRERHEVLAEAHALATQARASAGLLVTAPLVFTALVATVEPEAIAFLLATPVGVACLVLGIGLDALGALWMARITRSAA